MCESLDQTEIHQSKVTGVAQAAGGGAPREEGGHHGPPTWALFSLNSCCWSRRRSLFSCSFSTSFTQLDFLRAVVAGGRTEAAWSYGFINSPTPHPQPLTAIYSDSEF